MFELIVFGTLLVVLIALWDCLIRRAPTTAGTGPSRGPAGGAEATHVAGSPRRLADLVVVDDPDALHDRAVAGGAEIVMGLTDQDYGSREFAARDPHGNVWCFGTYRPGLG